MNHRTKFAIQDAWQASAPVARKFLRFVRKPSVSIGSEDQLPSSKPVIGIVLFALSLVISAAFAIAALPLMLFVEAEPGSQLQKVSAQSIPSVVLAVVILGPLIEEIMFRGWLSGTWRAVIASALFLALVFGIAPLIDKHLSVSAAIIQLGLVIIGSAGFALLAPIDTGRRLPRFERLFPYIFWAQGIVFGALHFQNVSASSPMVAGLATLPLVICGWIWGFARINLGLSGAVLLHAAYNVPAAAALVAFSLLQNGW
ncbi:CPBP family glutamic-type intramembrane protease [Qipengyuania spongiae]|uniref:CPBP family glutamic-type intramembrane protease n=1 Tax=Qipengyuania spongiae TaxID=2909673 RepID=A0ABY5SZI6_9SPHN|nr:CPBP family glutamic-type intramembrane protease [Qipengyuania spongiae]UVI39953.1 CPBP family glutamic-type intramembrane protease [Qipengyuania spongiae]